MKRAVRTLGLLIVLSMPLALNGCSGGGMDSPEKKGARLAPAQVAAAMYVQQWSQILWGLVTMQTGTQAPTVGNPVPNPDGSVSQRFTAADGTEWVMTAYPD